MQELRARPGGARFHVPRGDLLVIAALSAVAIGVETATNLILRLLDWILHGRNQSANIWIDTLLLFGVTATVLALRRVRELHAEIEQRRRTEAAYRESEARYRRLIDMAPDPIVV